VLGNLTEWKSQRWPRSKS